MNETATHVEITIAGERVQLLPERALFLPEHNTLFVADLHWGKAAAFRAAHVPVPRGTTTSDLERLARVLRTTGASQLVILGDLLHAKAGRHAETLSVIEAWCAAHAHIDVRLVRGNHDSHAGDPPASFGIACIDAPWQLGPFCCTHHPEPHEHGYVLAGHLHPHIALGRRGDGRVKLPCFVVGEHVAVLPAFTEFSGTGMYRHSDADRLFVIAENEVVAVQ